MHNFGAMQYGSMAAWQHEHGSMSMAAWQHGSMAAWQHGSTSITPQRLPPRPLCFRLIGDGTPAGSHRLVLVPASRATARPRDRKAARPQGRKAVDLSTAPLPLQRIKWYNALMKSLPFVPTVVKASEKRLDTVYAAAYAGLKGANLATAVGLTLNAYQQLCELDPAVQEHELRARADSELEHSNMLAQASREGDAKASLAILQHMHGWSAKQGPDVAVQVNIIHDSM